MTRWCMEKPPLSYLGRLALLIFIAVLIVAVFAGCHTASETRVLRNLPRAHRTALLVLNFDNLSSKTVAAEYAPWEVGLASMVMTDLETVGVFNVISRERLKDILKQQAFQLSGLVDQKAAIDVGKIAAAKYLLSGSFMAFNGNLRIESQIFSVETGVQIGAASVTGKMEEFFSLTKRLVLQLLPHIGALLNADEARRLTNNVETTSVKASLNNYSGEGALAKAERLREKGQESAAQEIVKEAKKRFQEALDHDPDYMRARMNLEKLVLAIPMTL